MFTENFFVTHSTAKKMASLGFEKAVFRYIQDENGDIEVHESKKPIGLNALKTAVYAPTLGEIELSANGWKIFESMRNFSILPEIELRAYVWITERILLGKKEVCNG